MLMLSENSGGYVRMGLFSKLACTKVLRETSVIACYI